MLYLKQEQIIAAMIYAVGPAGFGRGQRVFALMFLDSAQVNDTNLCGNNGGAATVNGAEGVAGGGVIIAVRHWSPYHLLAAVSNGFLSMFYLRTAARFHPRGGGRQPLRNFDCFNRATLFTSRNDDGACPHK